MGLSFHHAEVFAPGNVVPPAERERAWRCWIQAIVMAGIGVPLVVMAYEPGEWEWRMLLFMPALALIALVRAIRRTARYFSRGAALLVLEGEGPPHVGGDMEGYVRFRGAVPAGVPCVVKVSCVRVLADRDSEDLIERGDGERWCATLEETTREGFGDVRLPFHFRLRGDLPPSSLREVNGEEDRWYVRVALRARQSDAPYRFEPVVVDAPAPASRWIRPSWRGARR